MDRRLKHPVSCGLILFALMAALPSEGHAASPPSCTVSTVTPAQPTGLPGRLRLLEDRAAIEELKAAYVQALDAIPRDPFKIDRFLALCVEDLCVDYGPLGLFRGKQELRSYFEVILPTNALWSFHVASHPILAIKGNRATGAWKVVAGGVLTSDTSRVQQIYGTYQDEYVRTSTAWKLKVIKVTFDTPPTSP